MKQLFTKNKLVKTAGIATAALTLSVVTIIGAVSAQEPADEGQARRHGPKGNSELHSYLHSEDVQAQMQSAMAEALGLTVAELEAAKADGQSLRDLMAENEVDRAALQATRQAVMEDVLADAVAQGILTQEEADQFAARGAQGGFGGRQGGHGRHGHKGAAGFLAPDEMKATLAETLGLTVEELEAARENGQSIQELAEEQGVDLEEIQAARKAAMTAAIEDAVATGTITQEQADRMLKRLENGNFNGPRRGPRGQGDGFRGGFRGFRGGNGNGAAPNADSL